MTWTDKAKDMRNDLRALNRTIPDATKGFGTLSKAVKDGGVLDVKTKEFVALGISIAVRCEPCIIFHVEAAINAGTTREELGDVLAMAVQMGGGPSLMYAAKALSVYDEMTGAE
ncbi:carboxymuconolactone decarboxylase family protein [Maritalea mobilis]|uniref:carboxymuconolactone decarboxylase family protein n=1 Tax=Maritalea mobilis TaxID=483324 RepID=UPI001C97FAFE|nr:carboxymuconolactone decarboxylase family protein [Maritalea mobilis]MBY6201330.1 carboxymuconolactone decarboxylase family protein [Maritalea mobilis]